MGNLLAKLRWKRTEGRPASEQPAEEEGTRRDIPEKEYEKQYPEETNEAIPKHGATPEKVSEAAVNSNIVEETKTSVEQKEIPEPLSSSTLTQETKPSQTEVTKQSPSEEQKDNSISKIENIQVSIDEEPNLVSKESESNDENVEAVVKIQAGIRGYLTRKTLKEQKDNVSPSKSSNLEELKEEVKKIDEDSEKLILQSSTLQEVPVEINEEDNGNVEKAAVKIQSVYRGYRTRKNLSNIGDELIDESDYTNEAKEADSKETSPISTQEEEEEEVEEEEEENEGGALEQAAVKIQSTFRGYQVRKQRKNGPKKEDSKEQLLIDTSDMQDEKEKAELEDPEAEGKAAVKIQAMYRGYKVRKEIKMIGEDGDTKIEDSKHDEIIDFDKNNTNLIEYSEEEEEEEEEDEDDGILKSKTTILLSTAKEAASLLDKNDEEQCFQKPMVPVTNEATIPKSVSEPTVDLNSITQSKEDRLLSPSSD